MGQDINGDFKENFFSFEDHDYAKGLYPGVPYLFLFNAVRVTATVQSVRIPAPFNKILNLPLGFGAQKIALATAQRDDDTKIAPFAVSVCSLVRRSPASVPTNNDEAAAFEYDSSDFDPTNICYADRLMGPTSRYCKAGEPGCRGVVPQFNWDPSNIFTRSRGTFGETRLSATDYWGATDWRGNSPPSIPNLGPIVATNAADKFCFWGSPRYPEPEDNFGLVGMPCQGRITEDELITKVDADGLVFSRVGQKFCPLEQGLQLPASQAWLARQISKMRFDPPGSQSPKNLWNAGMNNGGIEAGNYPNSNTPISPLLTLSTKNNLAAAESFNESNPFKGAYACVPLTAPASPAPAVSSTTRPRWPRAWSRFGPEHNTEAISPLVPEVEGGTCNSWRTGWGHWDEIAANYSTARVLLDTSAGQPSANQVWYKYWIPPNLDSSTILTNGGNSQWISREGTGWSGITDGHLTSLPAWAPWVAIVGDMRPGNSGAEPCNGSDLRNRNDRDPLVQGPTPVESIPFKIIGYLRANVYDLDIGEPAPDYPPDATAPFLAPTHTASPSPNYFRFPYVHLRKSDGSLTNVPPPPEYQWSFRRPDFYHATKNPNPPCNLVRTRLSCRQPPNPLVGGTEQITYPRLIPDVQPTP